MEQTPVLLSPLKVYELLLQQTCDPITYGNMNFAANKTVTDMKAMIYEYIKKTETLCIESVGVEGTAHWRDYLCVLIRESDCAVHIESNAVMRNMTPQIKKATALLAMRRIIKEMRDTNEYTITKQGNEHVYVLTWI
jgi:hypothetical protein